MNELLDVLLVKARLATGFTLGHDVKATHAAYLCGASASNNGTALSGKWGDTGALALGGVRAGLATIRCGAHAALSANKNPLHLSAPCGALVPRLCRETLDSVPERDIAGASEAGEKENGNDETLSEHV